MTNIEYMKLKNKLVFRVTSKILVPSEQMVLEPYIRLEPYEYLVGGNCAYCAARVRLDPDEYLVQDNWPYCGARVEDKILDCANCPMELAGNGCISNTSSSWVIANDIWSKVANEDDKRELYNLTVRYNKENGND